MSTTRRTIITNIYTIKKINNWLQSILCGVRSLLTRIILTNNQKKTVKHLKLQPLEGVSLIWKIESKTLNQHPLRLTIKITHNLIILPTMCNLLRANFYQIQTTTFTEQLKMTLFLESLLSSISDNNKFSCLTTSVNGCMRGW